MTQGTRPIWLGPDIGTFDHARVHFQILTDERLGLAEAGVYMALVKHADVNTGECYPSGKTIAGYLKIHRDTVRKAIGVLRDAGYLTMKQSKGRAVNRYYLNAPLILKCPNEEQLDSVNRLNGDQLLPNPRAVNRLNKGHELEPTTRTKKQADFRVFNEGGARFSPPAPFCEQCDKYADKSYRKELQCRCKEPVLI